MRMFPLVLLYIWPFLASAQTSDLSGRVTDMNGNPLESVTVTIKGTNIRTATDAAGLFRLKNDSTGGVAILLFTFIGFEKAELTIQDNQPIEVKLTSSSVLMDSVVVVGYGTQKKADVTGSIATIPKQRLTNLPVTNVLQSMQGAVAGLNITSSTSTPGSTPSIYIRGLNSISANTTPLFVVDGVPYSGGLNDINSNDIENISILKDASATAIYGTRGSNGVVLITTKRGKNGKPQINYKGYVGPQVQVNNLHPYDGAGYAQKNMDYGLQTGLSEPAPYYNFGEKEQYDKGSSVDWMDLISQSGIISSNEISISGGTESVKYYVSGNYLKQKGALRGYNFNRASVRSNLDFKLTEWLNMGTTLSYVNKNKDGGQVDFYLATQMSPYGHVYNEDGTFDIYPMYPEQLYRSPLLGLNRPTQRRENEFNGNFYLDLKPLFLAGLKYRLNAAYAYNPSVTRTYAGRDVGNLLGTASISNSESKNWIIENILTYNKDFGLHHLDATALYSAQQTSDFNNGLDANTFINDQLAFYNIGAGEVQQVSSSYSQSNLLSQMLRLNYNYNQKYLLTLTIRRDGASVFGQSNKYASFPSVALGWNITEESFMKKQQLVNTLKLRLSYGITGNQAVGPYRTLTSLGTVRYVYNGVTAIGVAPSTLGNSHLKWEKTEGFNAGLDFELLDSRINGTVDYYQSNTADLLLNRQIPTTTGYKSVLDNVGKTENSGIEFTLNTKNVKTKDFLWETGINFSANKNKIVDLYGDKTSDVGNKWFIGKPLRAVYDYVMDGIFQTGDDVAGSAQPKAKPGDIRFADINGDGIINSEDKQYLGTHLPKYIAGLTNTFTYKNISLTIFLNAVQGSLRNNGLLDNWTVAGRTNLLSELGYWTAENKNNQRPSLSYLNSMEYLYPNNNSYIRIQDISLNYRFPTSIINKLKVNNLSVYLSGRNLHTFTKWVGFDPENDPQNGIGGTNTQNPDNGYPNIATYVFGVNLGF